MSKQLFKNKSASIKKKRQILISQALDQKITNIEIRAEKQGVAFPLNEHIESAIHRLIRSAEDQIHEIEKSSSITPSDEAGNYHPKA